MRVRAVFLLAAVYVLVVAGTALATPSTIIWIPSTDIQPCLVGHLGLDTYLRAGRNASGGRDPNAIDVGFTIGVLPFEKVQMEVGFDYFATGSNPNDQHPWFGNVKLGTPENSMFNHSPALAVGLYNGRPQKDIETKDAPFVVSGQNIVYGLVAKTVPALGVVPSLGRFSLGYYSGASRALQPDHSGLLVSWDRTISEISDKLWVGADYQGGHNVDGAWNIAFAWRFAKNVSVLFGYDIYTRKELSGENTFTIQLDIDFPQ